MADLVPLGPGVYAWLQETEGLPAGAAGLARPNAGVIVEDDGVTVVDTLLVPSQTRELVAALDELGKPVRRVVLTSSHVSFVGGSSVFRLAAVYGSRRISADLDLPPNVAGYQRLFPQFATEFEGIKTRPVSHVVTEPAWLTPAVVAAPLPGQIAENLAVQVPGASVVFAGALCEFGTRPLAFDGDPARWADSLDALVEWGVIIVPGTGPIGGEEEVRALQAYLRACVDAAGDPSALRDGPWQDWAHPEFDEVNVERAALLARGEDRPPASMLRLLGMA